MRAYKITLSYPKVEWGLAILCFLMGYYTMNFLMDTYPAGNVDRQSFDSYGKHFNAVGRSGFRDDIKLRSFRKSLSGKVAGKNYDMIMCSSYSPYYER